MHKISSFLNILIISLVVAIGGFFFYTKNEKEAQASQQVQVNEMSSQDLDSIVNKHIKETTDDVLRTKIMTEKSMLETRKKLAKLEQQRQIKKDKEDANVPLERQIRKESQRESDLTPADIINAKLNSKNQEDSMDAADKKEYARQWIANAREQGYLLELSEDLEVIKYTPIRKPSQQEDSAVSNPSD